MTGILGNPLTMMLFFRYCIRYKVTLERDKIKVLKRIVEKGKMREVRDIKPFVEGKKVLYVRNKKDDHVN